MKKITKKIITYSFVLAFIFSASACSGANKTYSKYSYEFFGTFDTIIQIAGYATSQKEFDGYSEHAYNRFNELNKLFDNYNTYEGINNIKTINDNAGKTPIEVDETLINLLDFCIKSNQSISSKTDVSLGSVLKIWHEYREAGLADPQNAAIPSMEELQSANAFTGIDNVIIDKQNSTVYLNEGSALDLGAVAKGYATELVARELFDMGFESFFILSGGNVKAVGKPHEDAKNHWSIGLQNPFYFDDTVNNENLIDIAYVNDMSVVTSGDYQRFYEVDGAKYHHLIDPQTLFPADYFRAVTIFTEDSGIADFLSTAVFLSTYEEGFTLVESMDGVEGYWIFADGTVEATDGAKELLKNLGGAVN